MIKQSSIHKQANRQDDLVYINRLDDLM